MARITLSASELSSIHFYKFPKIINQACLSPVDGDFTQFSFMNTDLSRCNLITLEKMISGFEKTRVTFVNLAGTSFANSLDAFDLKHVLLAFQRTDVVHLDLTGCLPLKNLELLKTFRKCLPKLKTVYLENIRDFPFEHQMAIQAIFPNAVIMLLLSELAPRLPVMHGGDFGAPRGAPMPPLGAHFMGTPRPPFENPMHSPAVRLDDRSARGAHRRSW